MGRRLDANQEFALQDGHDDTGDDKNTRWAEDRTDWAEDRTLLANERTFAGWMRTGMACVALALGLKAVFGDFEPTWVPKAAAEIFVVAALLIFFSAWRNSARAQSRIDEHVSEPQDARYFALVSAILAVGAVTTGVILWWL